MHARRVERMIDALEVIEPFDLAVELGANLFTELGLHLGNDIGELAAIEILDRSRNVGEHGQTLLRYFCNTAEHDDPLAAAAGDNGQDTRTDRRHDRCMTG